MEYCHIKSSIISTIAYDSEKEILEIKLKKNNQVRQYLSFPNNSWVEFKNADSIGKYFLKKIKNNYDELRLAQKLINK